MNVTGPNNHSHSTGPIGHGNHPVQGPNEPRQKNIIQRAISYISSIFNRHTEAPPSLLGRVQAAQKQSITSRIIGATLHKFNISTRADINQAIAEVTRNPMALKNLPSRLQNNLEVVKAAVSIDGMALEHASYNMQTNYDVVFTAVSQNGLAISHCRDPILRGSIDIANAAYKNVLPQDKQFVMDNIPRDRRYIVNQ